MAVNKVIFDEKTLIDISDSTVTEDSLLSGITAYNAAGEKIVGTMEPVNQNFDGVYSDGTISINADTLNGRTYGDIISLINPQADSYTKIVSLFYPVGSIYMSVDSTNPASLFGGTWERIAQGRAIFGADDSKYIAGQTVEAGLPDPELDIIRRENGSTTGVYEDVYGSNGYTSSKLIDRMGTNDEKMQSMKAISADKRYIEVIIGNNIYGNSTTVQPPAFVVYMWKRTA